jgi:threonine synthase
MVILAQMDGISVEPATAVTFAGLIHMVREHVIKPNDIVVINCTGHTVSVEKRILGDTWHKTVDISNQTAPSRALPEQGLLSALEQVAAGGARRILIIEDTIDAARLMQRILQSHGNYEVFLAHNGLAGLQMVREVNPDIVITDLMMPELDGFGVIEALKADEETAHIPIVVVTAKELTAQERARLGTQINMVLEKGSFFNQDFVEDLVDRLR